MACDLVSVVTSQIHTPARDANGATERAVMRRVTISKSRTAIILMALVIVLCSSGNLFGRWETPDTLRFERVSILYPGQPESGTLKAELHWATASGGFANMNLGIAWTGALVCDSFIPDPGLGEFLDTIITEIDNDSSSLLIVHYDYEIPHPDFPADYKYGDAYFSILDTGVVEFTGDVLFESQPIPGPFVAAWIESYFCISNPGDVDNDGVVGNIADVLYLIGYIFGTEPAEPTPFADTNGDCLINITDAVHLIHYIFAGGPGAGPGCEF